MANREQEWEDNYIREHYGKIMRTDDLYELICGTIRTETTGTAEQRRAATKTIRTMLVGLGYDELWVSMDVRNMADAIYHAAADPFKWEQQENEEVWVTVDEDGREAKITKTNNGYDWEVSLSVGEPSTAAGGTESTYEQACYIAEDYLGFAPRQTTLDAEHESLKARIDALNASLTPAEDGYRAKPCHGQQSPL